MFADPRRRALVIWAAANVVLGICAAFPLLGLMIVALHVRSVVFGTHDSPFEPNEIQGGEASGVIAVVLIMVIPILAVAALANWALIRRLRLRARGTLGMVVLTVAVLVAPAVILPSLL